VLLVKLIEPPCTERYARWCERSGIYQNPLLLDLRPEDARFNIAGRRTLTDYKVQKKELHLQFIYSMIEVPKGNGSYRTITYRKEAKK